MRINKYTGEKIATSTNGAGKTKYWHVEEWIKTQMYHPEQKLTPNISMI